MVRIISSPNKETGCPECRNKECETSARKLGVKDLSCSYLEAAGSSKLHETDVAGLKLFSTHLLRSRERFCRDHRGDWDSHSCTRDSGSTPGSSGANLFGRHRSDNEHRPPSVVKETGVRNRRSISDTVRVNENKNRWLRWSEETSQSFPGREYRYGRGRDYSSRRGRSFTRSPRKVGPVNNGPARAGSWKASWLNKRRSSSDEQMSNEHRFGHLGTGSRWSRQRAQQSREFLGYHRRRSQDCNRSLSSSHDRSRSPLKSPLALQSWSSQRKESENGFCGKDTVPIKHSEWRPIRRSVSRAPAGKSSSSPRQPGSGSGKESSAVGSILTSLINKFPAPCISRLSQELLEQSSGSENKKGSRFRVTMPTSQEYFACLYCDGFVRPQFAAVLQHEMDVHAKSWSHLFDFKCDLPDCSDQNHENGIISGCDQLVVHFRSHGYQDTTLKSPMSNLQNSIGGKCLQIIAGSTGTCEFCNQDTFYKIVTPGNLIRALRVLRGGVPLMPFYAVARGRKIGIYSTWPECQANVSGFSGARYKKFNGEQEAREFIAEHGGDSGQEGSSKASRKRAEQSGSGLGDAPEPLATKYRRLEKSCEDSVDCEALEIYTDGCCFGNGKKAPKAGVGVYFGKDDSRNISLRLKGKQTNNRAEIHACIEALKAVIQTGQSHRKVAIHTDSSFTINCMTKWIKGWMKNGWKSSTGEPVKNQEDLQKLHELCLGLKVHWVHVRGHVGIHGNEEADKLAKKGAEKPYVYNNKEFNEDDDEDYG